jgi:hypothetical protein
MTKLVNERCNKNYLDDTAALFIAHFLPPLELFMAFSEFVQVLELLEKCWNLKC